MVEKKKGKEDWMGRRVYSQVTRKKGVVYRVHRKGRLTYLWVLYDGDDGTKMRGKIDCLFSDQVRLEAQ